MSNPNFACPTNLFALTAKALEFTDELMLVLGDIAHCGRPFRTGGHVPQKRNNARGHLTRSFSQQDGNHMPVQI